MREVLYKNLTSVSHRKKDIFLKEVFEKDGVLARTERRCFYFIKDIRHLATEKEFAEWVNPKEDGVNTTRRHFHIFKVHNDALGEDKLICKISGTFYAVVENSLYTVAFLHSFKMSFLKGIS